MQLGVQVAAARCASALVGPMPTSKVMPPFLPALAFDESTSQLRGVKSSNTEAEPRTSALVAAGSGGQGSL